MLDHMKKELRKVTMNLPAQLLDDLLRDTGKGITETMIDLMVKEKNRRAWQALLSVAEEAQPYSYEEVSAMQADKKDRDLSRFARRKRPE